MSTEKVSVRELLLTGEGLSVASVNEIRQCVQGDPAAYEEVRDLVREAADSAESTRKSRADGKVAYAQGMALGFWAATRRPRRRWGRWRGGRT